MKAFDADAKLSQILKQTTGKGDKYGKILSELYEERNLLVHEISLGDIGHINIRNFKSLHKVHYIGEAVRKVIEEIEAKISSVAPADFPNILDGEHQITPRFQILEKQISEIEEKIRSAILVGNCDGDFTVEEWDALIGESRSYIQSELDFIFELNLPGLRYYNLR